MTAIGLPWTTANGIDITDLAHAGAVADIHTQLELAGIPALSPREVASKVDRYGRPTPPRTSSHVPTPNAGRRSTRPDIAIPDPDGDRFIAIDVAGHRRKTQLYWTHKLKGYRANSAIRAVWIICTSDTAASTVGRAADAALGAPGSFPLRLRQITPEPDGFLPFDATTLPGPMTDELSTHPNFDNDGDTTAVL